MKPREPKRPKTHTIVKRNSSSRFVEYFCTTCGKVVDSNAANKRCKGGK